MGKQISKNAGDIAIFQQNAITEARYELSSLQKNIFYLLLLKLKPGDPFKSKYKISIREINSSRNVRVRRAELYNASQSLMKLYMTLYDEKEKGFKTFSILTAADYDPDGKGDEIIVELDEKLYPYLIDVQERFTVFSLQNALNLKSKYSKRIYEMLCQFKSSRWFKISVRELKERFKLIDSTTGKEKYHEFSDFAKNVLEPAKREINANTDIIFKYTTELKGRKIEKILFKIEKIKVQEEKESSKSLSEPTQKDPQPISLAGILCTQFKIDPDLAKKVVENLPAEKIEVVIKAILEKYKARDIKSKAGYATTIFKAWLNGAEPTFEKTDIPKKRIPLKSTSQKNQIAVLENKIREDLTNKFGLDYNKQVYPLIVRYGGELESLSELRYAISKVGEAIDREEIERNTGATFEALISRLNGKSEHSNQPLVTQSNKRLNSVNSLGSLLDLSIKKPSMQIESAEEEKIRKEKTRIWRKLIDLGVEVEKADNFVEEHSIKVLTHEINIVEEVLKDQETVNQAQELEKRLRNRVDLLNE